MFLLDELDIVHKQHIDFTKLVFELLGFSAARRSYGLDEFIGKRFRGDVLDFQVLLVFEDVIAYCID